MHNNTRKYKDKKNLFYCFCASDLGIHNGIRYSLTWPSTGVIALKVLYRFLPYWSTENHKYHCTVSLTSINNNKYIDLLRLCIDSPITFYNEGDLVRRPKPQCGQEYSKINPILSLTVFSYKF